MNFRRVNQGGILVSMHLRLDDREIVGYVGVDVHVEVDTQLRHRERETRNVT